MPVSQELRLAYTRFLMELVKLQVFQALIEQQSWMSRMIVLLLASEREAVLALALVLALDLGLLQLSFATVLVVLLRRLLKATRGRHSRYAALAAFFFVAWHVAETRQVQQKASTRVVRGRRAYDALAAATVVRLTVFAQLRLQVLLQALVIPPVEVEEASLASELLRV